jgi:hypothetical protein
MGPYYDHQVGRFERPDPWHDHETLVARARQARAEATAELFRALWVGLKTATKAVVRFVRYAGAGAALIPPRGDAHHPGRRA